MYIWLEPVETIVRFFRYVGSVNTLNLKKIIFKHHPTMMFLQTLISEQTAAKLAAECTMTSLQGSTKAAK